MKILVTGATGFTGSYLASALVQEGHCVRALARRTSNITYLRNLGVEIHYGDLRDNESIRNATRGVEVIYHVAAIYRQAGIPNHMYWSVNVEGTRNLLSSAVQQGIERFVYCSTVGVHGHISNPPADETAPFSPGDEYQRTKLEAENEALSFHRKYGLAVVVARPTGIYGPGDLRLLKLFRAIQRKRFWMLGSGSTLYHLTFVTDVVSGLLLCGNKTNAVGQTYILGGNQYLTLTELANLIADKLDVPYKQRHLPVLPFYIAGWICEKICIPLRIEPPIYRRRVDFFTKDRAFNICKAKKDLGYQPQVNLPRGIQDTANWYKEKGYLRK